MRVKDLKPSKFNPRKISDKKLSVLGKSMKEFGDLSG
jgi:ParB-like chromosome segregation protein Spo0J